ncbi:alpha-1,2-fucosyltransferase [Mucilaginibacter sp. CSA2-8R]|uniref:alpha-1,2-fucosyltransferase n=1 Tax=Mucilaginibacter sp. CSA2-8R TaxID=3141542 RepID=UPI00315D9CB2
MIYVKLVSGLGNQLFQYAIGRMISLKNNMPLKLDVSFFESQSLRQFKLNHYNIAADIATPDEVDKFLTNYRSKSIKSKIFRKIDYRLPKSYRRYFIESEPFVYEPDLFKIHNSVYLDGYWQNQAYFADVNPTIFKELKIKEVYSAIAGNYLKKIQHHPSSVALHIRRGDYVTDKKAFEMMGVLPIDYYNEATKIIKSDLIDPHYFVFSDDLNWAKDKLNVGSAVTFVDFNGEISDYTELELMSQCKHNIIANSSFSWWGAFLNTNKKKIVISPQNWVKSSAINSKVHIQMSNWLKL